MLTLYMACMPCTAWGTWVQPERSRLPFWSIARGIRRRRRRSQLCDVFALELGKDRAQLGPEL